MANELNVDIVLNGDEALKTLKAIELGISKFSKDAVTGIKKTDAAFDVFKGTLGTLLAVNFADFLKNQVSASVRAFAEFETGLIAVQKTTDLTDKELKQFEVGIEDLARKLPVASKELLNIAQAAGQLGVKGTANLLNFTETIAKLGKSSDVSGDEAASALTRILNVTRENVGNIDELASAVVALGNNFAATESEIIRVANEVARATAIFGVSSAESAAFGATLRALGVRAEEGGSAIGKSFRAIEAAIAGGGIALQKLSELTGLSGAELKKQFGDDAVGVFQKFLVGLNNAGKSGKVLAFELEKLGLSGETILKVIPTLASSNEELARALGLANAEMKNATALNKEFAKFAESTESKTQILANAFEKLSRNIGEKFAVVLNAATPALAKFISGIGEDSVVAFARNATSVDKLRKEIALYQKQLQDVQADGKVSLLEANPELIASRIAILTGRLTELSSSVNTDSLAELEARLKSLNESASQPISFTFDPANITPDSLLPSPEKIAEQKAALIEQIKNLRQQISLENNTLVEESKANLDKDNENQANALATKSGILNEFRIAQKEAEIAERETKLTDSQIAADEDLQFLVDNLGRETTERELARISQIEGEKARNTELKKLREKAVTEEKASLLNLRQFENLSNTQKVQAQRDTLATISTLSQSSNSALFAIGKASSLALAGINVAEGVTKALAAFPPPFNFAAATAVGLAGAVSIAKIASAKPPSAGNFADGGIIEGPSQSGDRLTANVNAGEAIFNKRAQKNLFDAVNSGDLGGNGGGVVVNIQGDFLSSDQSVDKIIDSINDAVEFRNRKVKA
jgi:TP901 family phage tail tape measure protein